MNRKKIAALPVEKVTGKGKSVRAYLYEGTLIVDCYKNGEYLGRYCMQENGRYDFCSAKTGVWHTWKMDTVFNCDYMTTAEMDDESRETIKQFTGETWRTDIRSIANMEYGYNRDKRDRAMDRKMQRVNSLMARVPCLPDDFNSWIEKTVFHDREYMFRCPEGGWTCTACGNVHKPEKPYKHNQMVTCEHTGKSVQVKNRTDQVTDRMPTVIFQEVDETLSVCRHLMAETVWIGRQKITEAYENVRYFLPRDPNPLKIGETYWYYGQWNQSDEFEQEWWDTNRSGKRCYMEYCYPKGVKEALRHTKYEGLHFELFAAMGLKMQYNKLMMYPERCRVLEYVAKAGLRTLAEEISDWSHYYFGLRDEVGLNLDGKTAAEVLGIDAQRYHRLRQKNGGAAYLKWLKTEKLTGKKIPDETIDWMTTHKIDCDTVWFIFDRMSPVQVRNYLETQSREYKKEPSHLIEEWKDYLSMAERAGMDVMDPIVYRTKHLLKRHDELVEFLAEEADDEWVTEVKTKFPEIESILGRISDTYAYENEQYILSVPKTIREIVNDGRQLHHCSASTLRYFERISREESYIMFLRKKERPLHAWYTLEVEPGGTVRQKRTEYNRQPDLDEVVKFIGEWHKVLKTRLKAEDLTLADRAREIRIIEMRELKETNEAFAKTLAADLMEVG